MADTSLEKDKIRVLLLEGIHENAVENLKAHGYSNVELLPTALTDAVTTGVTNLVIPKLTGTLAGPVAASPCSSGAKVSSGPPCCIGRLPTLSSSSRKSPESAG